MGDVFDEIAPASDIFDEVSPKERFPMLPFTGSGEISDLVASGQYQPPRLPRVGFTPRAGDESTLIGPGPFSGMLEAATGRKGEPITQGTARKAGAIIANSVLSATEGALDPKTQAIVLAATVQPEVVIPILTAQMGKSGATKLAEGIVDLQQGRDSDGVVKIGEAGTELGFAAAPALHASAFVGEPQAGSMAERAGTVLGRAAGEGLAPMWAEPSAPNAPPTVLRPFQPARVQPGERAGFPPVAPRTRPVVPETLAQPRETVIETIRNADARTLAQIQALFPEAKLSREQARVFRNIAFPPVAEPVRPQATAAEVLGRPPGTLPPPTPAEESAIQEQLRTEQPGIATVESPASAAAPAPSTETISMTVPNHDPENLGARERIKRRQYAGATREQAVSGDAADIDATRKWVDDNTREGDVIEASNGRRYRRDEEGNWYEIQDGKVRSGSRMGDNSGFRGGKIVQRGTKVRTRDDAVIAGEEAPAPVEAPKPAPLTPAEQAAAPAARAEEAPAAPMPVEAEWQTVEVGRFKDEMAASRAVDENVNHRSYRKSGDDYVVYEDRPSAAEAPKPAPAPVAEPATAATVVEPFRMTFEQFQNAPREGRLLEELRKVPKRPETPEVAALREKHEAATAAVEKAKLEWIYDRAEPSKRRMVEAALRNLPKTKQKIVKAYEDTLTAMIREQMKAQEGRQRELYDALVAKDVIESGAAPPAPPPAASEPDAPVEAAPVPEPTEPSIPLINLRESEATPMALGKIKARDPQRWQDIVKYFKVGDKPADIAKAAQAKLTDSPIRPGPGAASPIEFAERAAKGAAGTPPPAAPVTLDASATPTPEVVRRAKDFNIFNTVNSGQWTFYFGKLGAAAKAAWDKMALSGFAMRENIGRDVKQYVDGLLKSLPRPIRAKGGKAFFEALDGRDLTQIEEAWTGKPGGEQVIAGARAIKTRLEEIRMTILETKRDAYRSFLMGLDRDALAQLFDRNMVGARNVDTSKYTKTQFADGLTRSALPDDWGIADGTYLPRMFFGDWKVIAKRGEESQFVTRAKTVAEAKARIFEYSRTNPEWANAQWSIEPEMAVSGDIVRLGDPRFWRLVQQMKDNLGVSSGEIKQAQQGVIGRTASKQKWFGNLQRRLGLGGYSHDYSATMRAYFAGFHRWLELSKLNREVQPLIDQVRSEGRPHAAEALTDILDHMWGKPAKSTVLFDNFLRRIPGVRDIVKPLFLDRASRNLRAAIAYGTLTTARFAVVNRLQPLQGLYPLVGERILLQAKIRQHTADGRALLDRAGVRFDPGQYGEAAGVGGKAREVLERVRGERSNQELAFLAMYQHGIESGLGDAAAINYAKLRGQLLTQFTPNPADVPPIMRGPLTGLLFQFKRFPLKQGELLVKMAGNGQLGGLARWFGSMAAIGGLGYFMRQLFFVPPDDRERVRRSIEQEHGKTVANGIMYGLPGLLNVDLSGSLVLGDEPFGDNFYEKLGRQVSGPGISLAYETGKALGTAARQPATAAQQTITQLRRIPALRPVSEVLALLQSDYDVRSPDGEVKYRKAMRDALVGVGSFRTANEANMQSAVSAIVELKKQQAELKNAAFVAVQSTPAEQKSAIDAIQKFNARWPEVVITPTELTEYIYTRARGMNKTDYERVAGRKFAPLAPQPTAP